MIHIDNRYHGHAIMKAAGGGYSPVTMKVISREEDGELYGGFVFESYTGAGGSVLVHSAAFKPNWINRDLLYIIFDYPFKQMDCKVAFAQVRADNEAALKFNESVGWKRLHVIEDVFPDCDMVLMRLKRDECRFLNVKPRTIHSGRTDDGKAESTGTARL